MKIISCPEDPNIVRFSGLKSSCAFLRCLFYDEMSLIEVLCRIKHQESILTKTMLPILSTEWHTDSRWSSGSGCNFKGSWLRSRLSLFKLIMPWENLWYLRQRRCHIRSHRSRDFDRITCIHTLNLSNRLNCSTTSSPIFINDEGL
jgi:hypothetical protein